MTSAFCDPSQVKRPFFAAERMPHEHQIIFAALLCLPDVAELVQQQSLEAQALPAVVLVSPVDEILFLPIPRIDD